MGFYKLNIWQPDESILFPFYFLLHVTCFYLILFFTKGLYELIHLRSFSRDKQNLALIIFFVISFALPALYTFDVLEEAQTIILRDGIMIITMALGFSIMAMAVLTHQRFKKGFGQRFLGIAFIFNGLYMFYQLVTVVLMVAFDYNHVINITDVVNVLASAVLAISMVMWVLEDERLKLENTNRELDRILYSTSHDLRAPIASILGLTYLGKIEFEGEREKSFMDMIESRVRKLDLIIGNILSLSRTKKVDIKIEDIKLKELLEDTITDVKFNKGASAIELIYEPSDDHVFKSDYSQMRIIMANLISNAVKYHNLNQEKPYIKILFKRKKSVVRITVEDNGNGIPEEGLPKIFDMFYRASSETEGTGLGLYIVKDAVEKLRGYIDVSSVYGKGTSFTITLDED
jgi:signal transduction histidine kinase